jgi:flagellum-specific peptidoglycan hydrolase FlgJ
MANKTKSDYDKMSNEELVAYLDGLSKDAFNSFVDADTKVRYFLFKYGKQFADAVKGTNLFYAGVVAQSIGETGYGRSELTSKANNFAGVKYIPSLHSDFYETKTKEVVKGKTITVTAKFAKFPTALEGIKTHISTLMKPNYEKARLNAKSPEEQIKMIVQAGYATLNPTAYVNQIKGNIRRIQNKIPIGKVV